MVFAVGGVLAKVERREMRQLFQRSAGERNPSRYANARPSARAGEAMRAAATVGVSLEDTHEPQQRDGLHARCVCCCRVVWQ